MISDIAAMLESFIKKEKKILERYHIINHPGMIGDMYEGMTKEVLRKAVLPNLDLRVVDGKILKHDQTLSKQMDCMLVFGEGEKIPYTNSYVYNVSQVIATLEVKKNLFTKQIIEAFKNLNSYGGRTLVYENIEEHEELMIHHALSTIFYGKEIGKHAWEYPPTEENTYYNIVADACSPLKIIFAYDGVKTEKELRSSVLKLVDQAIGQNGYEPSNFPDLIICNNNSVIKTNGIPFGIPFLIDETWPFYCSANKAPILIMIQMIWHRLYCRFGLSKDYFNAETFFNKIRFFLGAQFIQQSGKAGCLIIDYPMEIRGRDLYAHKDDPIEISNIEFKTLIRLMKGKQIDIDTDEILSSSLTKKYINKIVFVQQLHNKGLININGNAITLSIKNCILFKTEDGRYFAGNPEEQNLKRWLT